MFMDFHQFPSSLPPRCMKIDVFTMAITTVTHCRPLFAAVSSMMLFTFVSFNMRSSRKSRRIRVTLKRRKSSEMLLSVVK